MLQTEGEKASEGKQQVVKSVPHGVSGTIMTLSS